MLGFLAFSSAIIALGESNRRGFAARSRLAAIVESSDDAIVSKNLDGVITSWNNGCRADVRVHGRRGCWSAHHLIIPQIGGMKKQEFLSGCGRGERIEHFETVRSNGKTVRPWIFPSQFRQSETRRPCSGRIESSARRYHNKSKSSEHCARAKNVSAPLLRPHPNA